MAGDTSVRVDHAVSSGTFSLDGETFDVDNNIWVVGDDEECIVIDAPHDVDDILRLVAGRKVKALSGGRLGCGALARLTRGGEVCGSVQRQLAELSALVEGTGR